MEEEEIVCVITSTGVHMRRVCMKKTQGSFGFDIAESLDQDTEIWCLDVGQVYLNERLKIALESLSKKLIYSCVL